MSVLDIPTAEVFEPLLAPARDKVARGGRGSGKSHFFAGLLIEDSLAEPGNSGGEGLFSACLREVQKDLKQSAKRLIEQKLIHHRLGEADGFKVFEDCIKTPGDGLIIFKGMNNYTADSIKSLEGAKRAWWEEAHTATQKSINLLRPTMRAPGSQLWWSYNPNLESDPIDKMCMGVERPTGMKVVNASWRDNPWWTAELEQERQDCLRMQPEQYDHIYEGGYAKVFEGAYFARQLIDAKNRIGLYGPDPLVPIRTFHDIGGPGAKADYYSIVVCQFVAGSITILDHYCAQGMAISDHVEWMRERGYAPRRRPNGTMSRGAHIRLPHDGLSESGPYKDMTWEKAWQDAGFDADTRDPDGLGAPKLRIEAVRRLFPRIRFNEETTRALRQQLGKYRPHIGPDGRDLGPLHDDASHDADAFGLMALEYEPPKQQQDNLVMPQLGIV